jgi:hypothetical protein
MFVALALMTLGAILFVPASLLIRRIEHQSHAVLARTGMMLFAVFGVFNWWWEPSYIKYWVVPLVGWWCTAAVFIELELRHKLSMTRLRTTWPIAVMAIWVVLNLRGQIVEARTPNDWLSAADPHRPKASLSQQGTRSISISHTSRSAT